MVSLDNGQAQIKFFVGCTSACIGKDAIRVNFVLRDKEQNILGATDLDTKLLMTEQGRSTSRKRKASDPLIDSGCHKRPPSHPSTPALPQVKREAYSPPPFSASSPPSSSTTTMSNSRPAQPARKRTGTISTSTDKPNNVPSSSFTQPLDITTREKTSAQSSSAKRRWPMDKLLHPTNEPVTIPNNNNSNRPSVGLQPQSYLDSPPNQQPPPVVASLSSPTRNSFSTSVPMPPWASGAGADSNTPHPVVTSLSVYEGPAAGGIKITLSGPHFDRGDLLYAHFGPYATSTSYDGPNALSCTLPRSIMPGKVSVYVSRSSQSDTCPKGVTPMIFTYSSPGGGQTYPHPAPQKQQQQQQQQQIQQQQKQAQIQSTIIPQRYTPEQEPITPPETSFKLRPAFFNPTKTSSASVVDSFLRPSITSITPFRPLNVLLPTKRTKRSCSVIESNRNRTSSRAALIASYKPRRARSLPPAITIRREDSLHDLREQQEVVDHRGRIAKWREEKRRRGDREYYSRHSHHLSHHSHPHPHHHHQQHPLQPLSRPRSSSSALGRGLSLGPASVPHPHSHPTSTPQLGHAQAQQQQQPQLQPPLPNSNSNTPIQMGLRIGLDAIIQREHMHLLHNHSRPHTPKRAAIVKILTSKSFREDEEIAAEDLAPFIRVVLHEPKSGSGVGGNGGGGGGSSGLGGGGGPGSGSSGQQREGSRGGAKGFTCLWEEAPLPGEHHHNSTTGGEAGDEGAGKICGKFIKRRDHVQNHVRAHFGIKPFRCQYSHPGLSICDTRFLRLDDLKRHMRTLHKMDLDENLRIVPLDTLPKNKRSRYTQDIAKMQSMRANTEQSHSGPTPPHQPPGYPQQPMQQQMQGQGPPLPPAVPHPHPHLHPNPHPHPSMMVDGRTSGSSMGVMKTGMHTVHQGVFESNVPNGPGYPRQGEHQPRPSSSSSSSRMEIERYDVIGRERRNSQSHSRDRERDRERGDRDRDRDRSRFSPYPTSLQHMPTSVRRRYSESRPEIVEDNRLPPIHRRTSSNTSSGNGNGNGERRYTPPFVQGSREGSREGQGQGISSPQSYMLTPVRPSSFVRHTSPPPTSHLMASPPIMHRSPVLQHSIPTHSSLSGSSTQVSPRLHHPPTRRMSSSGHSIHSHHSSHSATTTTNSSSLPPPAIPLSTTSADRNPSSSTSNSASASTAAATRQMLPIFTMEPPPPPPLTRPPISVHRNRGSSSSITASSVGTTVSGSGTSRTSGSFRRKLSVKMESSDTEMRDIDDDDEGEDEEDDDNDRNNGGRSDEDRTRTRPSIDGVSQRAERVVEPMEE